MDMVVACAVGPETPQNWQLSPEGPAGHRAQADPLRARLEELERVVADLRVETALLKWRRRGASANRPSTAGAMPSQFSRGNEHEGFRAQDRTGPDRKASSLIDHAAAAGPHVPVRPSYRCERLQVHLPDADRIVGHPMKTAPPTLMTEHPKHPDVQEVVRCEATHRPRQALSLRAEVTPRVAAALTATTSCLVAFHGVDLGKRSSHAYFRRLRAITTRWIWLVPS